MLLLLLRPPPSALPTIPPPDRLPPPPLLLLTISSRPRPDPPAQLTEEETEYKIVGVKHVLEAHVVFQFLCTNTVREQVLEDVSVTMDLSEAVSAGCN